VIRADALNILLVDDQPAKLLTYESILTELGENLIKATSARQALDTLLHEDIAVIVMDVSMPDVDGFELATMIRQHPRCAKTAIIFVSAVHISDVDFLKGYETGAVDYLSVPVVPQVLRAKIRVLADLHRATKELTKLNTELERRVNERSDELRASTHRLRASEARFRSLAERMPHLVWESDADANAMYLSPRWYEYTGRSLDSSLGQEWLQSLHSDDRERVLDLWRQTFDSTSTSSIEYEMRLRRGDGVYRWFTINGEGVRGDDGAIEKWVGTATDIDERRRAEESLREADRRKDEFLAMLAHELRNPLAPIRNAVKLLRDAGQTDPVREWSRDVIERQVDQLTRLVDDLLDVSRITRGKIQLQVETLDLATVVSGAVETSRPRIDARKHQLEVRLPGEPVRVVGDLVRLTQVVSNLLNNAAKFQDEGGFVSVRAEREDDDAVIRVRDQGTGIAPEMLGEVFELFAQAERTMDRAEGGLGIGLSLVKSLVEMHGGSVSVHSAGRGRGAEFTVRLPALVAAEDPGKQADVDPSANRPGEGVRVLVVDDNQDAADSLTMLLALRGFDASVCHDGTSALAAALEKKPDVIVLDLGLPGVDGFEVCRRLREAGMLKTCIIAVTGFGQDEDRRKSQSVGFDAHMVKPVDPDQLVKRISESLAARR
jgi:PAS domain S-box-containing protein